MKKAATKAQAESKIGRPTKYGPHILTGFRKYMTSCEDEYFDYHKTQGEKSDSYERKVKVNLPTVQGLALFLKVDTDTLGEWTKVYPAFSGALRELKALQSQRLLAGGLSGDYNPVIAKLILSANHGMTDRVDHTSGDEKLPVPLLANAIQPNNSNSQGTGAK